jgi:DNA modification methylase
MKAPPPLGTATVIKGNALDLPIADESVDLIVSSPPYFALRSYQDDGSHYEGQIGSEDTPQQFLESLWAVMAECWRVLKPTGSCWINLGDKYAGSGGHNNAELVRAQSGGGKYPAAMVEGFTRNAPKGYNKNSAFDDAESIRAKSLMGIPWRFAIGCIDGKAAPEGQQWILRAEVVWDKPNGLPESVTDRVRRSHEQWFHLVKQGSYFAAVDEIRDRYSENKPWGMRTLGQSDLTRGGHLTGKDMDWHRIENPLGKLPGSVWEVPTEPLKVPEELGIVHFAAFPTAFPIKIIQGWCPTYGTILDMFGGTGTTAMVAKALGRNAISVDLSGDYCRLAEWRTKDEQSLRNVRSKVYGISKEMPQIHPEQSALFGDGDAA